MYIRTSDTMAYLIDARRGIAGDMVLAAFADLELVPAKELERVLEVAGSVMARTEVSIKRVEHNKTKATKLEVKYQHRGTIAGETMLQHLVTAEDALGLSKGRNLARKILMDLLESESKVHGTSVAGLRLHETGEPDTLVDILGTAFLYEELKLYQEHIVGTTIGVGSGRIKIAHGYVSVPAPATRELLRGMMFNPGPGAGERATPTGVAIFKNIVHNQTTDVPTARKIGRGVGSKELPGSTSVVRVIDY